MAAQGTRLVHPSRNAKAASDVGRAELADARASPDAANSKWTASGTLRGPMRGEAGYFHSSVSAWVEKRSAWRTHTPSYEPVKTGSRLLRLQRILRSALRMPVRTSAVPHAPHTADPRANLCPAAWPPRKTKMGRLPSRHRKTRQAATRCLPRASLHRHAPRATRPGPPMRPAKGGPPRTPRGASLPDTRFSEHRGSSCPPLRLPQRVRGPPSAPLRRAARARRAIWLSCRGPRARGNASAVIPPGRTEEAAALERREAWSDGGPEPHASE